MKKRVLSLVMAFVLSFSMMPMPAFAEEAGTVTEQKAQNGEDTVEVSNTGEETAEVSPTVEDISGGNAVTKDAEVEAAQALINALPEEVTADNADELQAQLMAINEALAALDEAQTAKLDMTRLENICAALNGAVAVQAGEHNNTHPICGATCTHNDESHLLPAGKEWQAVSTLTDSMAAGYYYLTNDVTLDATWTPANGTVLDLNGYSITVTEDVDAITISASSSFTLTDCNSSGGVHYFAKNTEKYNLWEPETDGNITVTGGVITHSSGKNGSGIFMEGNGTFTMYGGTICGNYNSTAAGAGVRATKSKIIMFGGAISGNVAGSSDSNKNGGGVYLNGDGSSFDMFDNAKITDNTAKGFGGGVSMTGGASGKVSFTMSGNAKITGNMCTGSACGGAGVYATNGEITMNDSATISDNSSQSAIGYGGGVFVSKNATFTMNDNATISGNSAYVTSTSYRNNTGGGVLVFGGTFIMNSGSIRDNMAENGAGVYVGESGSTPGAFTMNGGTITNNKVIGGNGGGVYVIDTATFKIANGASVKDNLCDSEANNVYLPDGKTIEITGKLTDANNVGVTVETLPTEINNPVTVASGDGTYTVDDSDEKAFFADADGYNVYYDKGELKLYNGTFHKHKVCVDTNCENCSHDSVIWEPISDENELRSINTTNGKYYYLTGDIELTTADPWYPANGVVLDLCGHSITGDSSYVIQPYQNYTFTLTDCKGDTGNYGKITHLEGGEGGPGIYVDQGTNFHFYGGCITGNNSTSGVVNVLGNFYMYGGEIKDNADTSTSNSEAAVYVQECGSFDMSGGKITGNSIARGCGGVYVKGAITVSGDAQITGNQENGKTSNVYLASGKSITVSGALSDSASIGVTSKDVPDDDTPVTIATATTDNWIKEGNFVTDSSLYKVTVSEDGKTANLGLHEHKWGVKTLYSSNGLQECCILEGCTSTTNGTLILTAPNQKYSGAPYDVASYNTSGDWKHDPSVGEYYYTDSEGNKIPAPVNVGTYNVNLDVDGVTATQEFTISAENLYSGDFTFQGPKNLTYDGSPKEATVTVLPGKADVVGNITVKYYKGDAQVANPIDAGTYTVKIDVTAGTGYNAVSNMEDSTWTFAIAPKPVTIIGISAQNKSYDGNADAAITGNPEISGLVAGDENDVTVEDANAKATFADKNAGERKTVRFTGYSLSGAKADNYKLSQPDSVTADIAPKELTIGDVTVADKAYDGTMEATITDVTFNGLVNSESLIKDTDYTVTGSFANAAVGADKEVTVKVELSDSVKNYTLSGTEYKKSGCEISKATVADPAARDFTIINGNNGTTYTVELKKILLKLLESPREYGNCTYSEPQLQITDNNYEGTAIVRDDGMLALKITATGNTEGDIGTVTVTAETDNYTPITLKFNIKATAKILPQLDGTLTLSPAEITYGDKLESITISGTMKDDTTEVPGRFAWQDPTTVLTAGTHNDVAWKFTPTSSAIYAETTGTTTVKVNKAEQSGAVLMDNYTYNETPKTPDLTDKKGDPNATVTYYYSTTRTNSGGTEWKNIGPTTLNAGTYYMYAVIGATGNYNAYTTEAKAFEVWKAAPIYTKPSGLTAKYGQKLSEIKLPNPAGNMSGTWNWEAPDTVIDKTGTVSYDAYFTPEDTNYKKVVGAAIAITVTPGDGRNLATEELKLAFNDSTDHTYTPDWSDLPAGQTWSYNCESSISNGSKATLTKLNVSAANGELTYAVSGGKAGDEITVILKAQCNNYKDFTITLNIKITKAMPTGAPKYTLITTEGKILADAGLTLTGSTLKPAEGKLEWMDEAENVLTDDTEVKVNTTYWWRFTPTDTNYDSLTGKVELYHVDAPAISAQPKSVFVTAGEKATFEVTTTGTDVTYQWKIDRNDGNGFVDINGANGVAYTTGVTDKDCDGFKYQCVIRNAAGSVTTDTAVLTVKEKYTITATAGAHGSISPSGNVEVMEGSSQIFVITAEDGYEIDSLTVDGKAVDAATSYTFENVAAAHTIAVTFKQQYKIIDGADSSWNQDTDGSGSIKIRGNGEFSKFVNVKVDGTIVDPANYTASEGSTIIELHADYLKTLSEGSHTFEIAWTDGTAKTSFTVARNTSGSDDTGNNDNDDSNKDSNNDSSNNNSGSNNTAGSGDNTAQTLTGSPNTGDASGLWIALFMVSAAGLAVMLVRRKNSIKK